jgi:pimeloyl-ACP methyl ester carboxylesterase
MKAVIVVSVFVASLAAAITVSVVGLRTGDSSDAVEILPLPTPIVEEPLPSTWMEGLDRSRGGETFLLSCLDEDADGALTGLDHALFDGLVLPLDAGKACDAPGASADYYAGAASDRVAYSCGAPKSPLLIVAVGSAGSDLLDPTAGESMGVLALVNALQQRAADAQIATTPILTQAAVFGTVLPQVQMEALLAAEIRRHLEAMPCLRAVIIGHSHGGATVTAVTAALDAAYASRVLGVIIDRTTVLYDTPDTAYPAATRILNVFQTNEGWHGVPIDLPNVYNIDQSYERAPVALSDGGGGLADVGHKTLDDSAGVQRLITDAAMNWLEPAP